jgi:iron complex transport system permease protein
VSDAVVAYERLTARRASLLAGAVAIALLAAVLDIATGPAFLSPATVGRSILGLTDDRATNAIVWTIRLPVALMALVVGLALGLSGAVMQTILNNPLASCYTLGISAAAGFGAGLAILFGGVLPIAVDYAIPLNAFLFAALACALVYLMGRLRGMTPEAMVLAGIALLFLFQALLALLQFIASPEALQQIVFWLFGSLAKSSWDKIAIVTATTAAIAPLLAARLPGGSPRCKLGDDRAAAASASHVTRAAPALLRR